MLQVGGLATLFVGLIIVRDPRWFRRMMVVGTIMLASAILIFVFTFGLNFAGPDRVPAQSVASPVARPLVGAWRPGARPHSGPARPPAHSVAVVHRLG